MEKMDNFFDEMRQLFLEKDLDEFEELKEDMMEHISIKLEQGEELEVILAKLGTPKTIVDAFYEDKRLEKVGQYETDIVAIEDVTSVALQEKKDRLYKKMSRFRYGLMLFFNIIFWLLVIASFICFFWNIVNYRHVSFIILLILGNSLFGLVLLKDMQHKSTKKMSFFTLIFIIISFFIVYSIHYKLFFYKGERISEAIELNQEALESLTLTGDFPVNLTIEQTSKKYPTITFEGRMTKESKDGLKRLGSKKEKILDLGEKSPLSMFTSMGELEVVLSIPKHNEKNLLLDFEDADIQGRNIDAKNIELLIKTGDIELEDIESQHFRVVSDQADILINQFDTPIEITNNKGKSIIKNGVGNINITATNGLTNLLNINGDKGTISNKDGKLVMTDTSLDNANITSKNNTVVIENQLGQTTIAIENGKLILRENQGKVLVDNNKAPIIVTQHLPVNGEIISHSGVVKWVQYSDEHNKAPKFKLESNSKHIRNDFKNSDSSDKGHEFMIKSDTGEINIIKK
ncbi:DUF4097 family beta strand repeat-containing protein [Vagococcus sp. JNUCC 83]